MMDEFLALLQEAKSDDERLRLTLEFHMHSLPDSMQEAIRAAAIPHWFDEQYLATMLGSDANQVFQESGGVRALAALPYIEPFPDRGYNVHERSRAVLRDLLWQTDRQRFLEWSRRAEAYSRAQGEEDAAWVIERIYHLLATQPEDGADMLRDTGWRWQNPPSFAYDKVEAMAKAGRELVDAGMLNGRGRGWTLYWEGHIAALYDRNQEAYQYLSEIDLSSDDDPYLAAVRLATLGDVELQQANYEAARARYEEARPIYATIGDRLGEANTIKALGELYGELKQEKVAIDYLNEAAGTYHQLGLRLAEAGCFNSMADLVDEPGREEEVLRFYDRAIEIFPYAMWYRNRANSLIKLDRYEEAIIDLDAAESLQPGQPFAFFCRGEIHLWQREPDIAGQLFEQAISLRPLVNDFHFYLALAYLAQGQITKALSSVKTSLDLTYKSRDLENSLREVDKLERVYGPLKGIDNLRQTLKDSRLLSNPANLNQT